MALSAAEIESLMADLQHQYKTLSRELSETHDLERKAEISDLLSSIDYQISRLEEQWLEVRPKRYRTAGTGW
jgi:hypothetical protein